MDLKSISESAVDLANKNFYKEVKKGLSLKESQIEVLERYDIDYNSVSSIRELLYLIEEVLEECDYMEDLDNVSLELSEYIYYNETNK